MTFKVIEHTADTGLDLEAPTLEGLFEDGARGLLHILELKEVTPSTERTICIDPLPLDILLNEWLTELLSLFDTDRFAVSDVSVKKVGAEVGLEATAVGEPLVPKRHEPQTEIKGVTYHGLSVDNQNGKWTGRVIFDL